MLAKLVLTSAALVVSMTAAGLLLPAKAQVSEGLEVTTEHFMIGSTGGVLPGVGPMLEQLYARLVDFFQKEPKERIHVLMLANREQFQEQLERIGGTKISQELLGLYDSSTETAYLRLDRSEVETREILLHEATHAFRGNVEESARFPADWYEEGLADYFALHNWDGSFLRTGISPIISSEDWAAKALQALEERSFDLKAVAYRTIGYDEAESWALAHFLMTYYREEMSRLGWVVKEAKEGWETVFGPMTQDFVDAYHQHLQEIQQPWEVVRGAWSEAGSWIACEVQGQGMALLKTTPEVLTAVVQREVDAKGAGLAFDFTGPEHFGLFCIRPGNQLDVLILDGGEWTVEGTYPLEPGIGTEPLVLSLALVEGKAHLAVNGRALAVVPSTGRVGLAANSGSARFQVVSNSEIEAQE